MSPPKHENPYLVGFGNFMSGYLSRERTKPTDSIVQERRETHHTIPCASTRRLDSFTWDLVDHPDHPYAKGTFRFSGHHHCGPPLHIRDYRPATVQLFREQEASLKQLAVYLDIRSVNQSLEQTREERTEFQRQIDFFASLRDTLADVSSIPLPQAEKTYLELKQILENSQKARPNKRLKKSEFRTLLDQITQNLDQHLHKQPPLQEIFDNLTRQLVSHMESMADQLSQLDAAIAELTDRHAHISEKITLERQELDRLSSSLSRTLALPCTASDVTLTRFTGVSSPQINQFLELSDLPSDLDTQPIGTVEFRTLHDKFPKPLPILYAMLMGPSDTSAIVREFALGIPRRDRQPSEIIKTTTYHSGTFRHAGEARLRVYVPQSLE